MLKIKKLKKIIRNQILNKVKIYKKSNKNKHLNNNHNNKSNKITSNNFNNLDTDMDLVMLIIREGIIKDKDVKFK